MRLDHWRNPARNRLCGVNQPSDYAARIEAIYASWGAFFASEEKHNYLRDPVRQDGFFPFKSEHAKDAKEKDLKSFSMSIHGGSFQMSWHRKRQFYGDLVGLGMIAWLAG